MTDEQQIRVEALKLALSQRAIISGNLIDVAREYETYIAGQPVKTGPAATRKDEGEAGAQPRKPRSVTPAT